MRAPISYVLSRRSPLEAATWVTFGEQMRLTRECRRSSASASRRMAGANRSNPRKHHQIDATKFLLPSYGFHWINEMALYFAPVSRRKLLALRQEVQVASSFDNSDFTVTDGAWCGWIPGCLSAMSKKLRTWSTGRLAPQYRNLGANGHFTLLQHALEEVWLTLQRDHSLNLALHHLRLRLHASITRLKICFGDM